MAPQQSRMRSSTTHRRSAGPSSERPRLSTDDKEALKAKFAEKFKIAAKPFQLKAIEAQIEGIDMIVQAPTGSGKTAIAAGPHLWPGNEDKFTIMVCPLLSLEEEMVNRACTVLSCTLNRAHQVETFDLDYGLRAVTLNSKNGACSPLVLKVC